MKELDFDVISLDLLRTLVVFSESGTMEATAQKLGLTQAGVSLQLKKLEEQVGGTLFLSLGRKKALTELARDLCRSVAPPLRDLGQRLAEVRRTSREEIRRILRVGGRAETLPRLLEAIDDSGRLIFQSMTEAEALSALREDRLDAAVVADAPESGELVSRPLFEETFSLALPRAWTKAKTWDQLDVAELSARPAARGGREKPSLLDAVADALKIDVDPRYACEDWSAIGRLIVMGRAWAAMPTSHVPAGVAAIEVPSRILKPVRVHLVHGRHLKGLERRFLRS